MPRAMLDSSPSNLTDLDMLKLFTRYASVGIINTIIHWGVFAALVKFASANQSTANLLGFCVAVTFSFFVNAKYTFETDATKRRYFIFVTFMGCLAFLAGKVADLMSLPAILTLIFFSGTSLVLGFIYSKFVVFK